jgi:hypothetical protein
VEKLYNISVDQQILAEELIIRDVDLFCDSQFDWMPQNYNDRYITELPEVDYYTPGKYIEEWKQELKRHEFRRKTKTQAGNGGHIGLKDEFFY